MNIYYSRSNNVDDSVLNIHIANFIDNLPQEARSRINLTKHTRGSEYNPQLVDRADLVIVGIARDGFVGKGCFTEISRAYKKEIPVLFFREDNEFFQTLEDFDADHSDADSEDWRNYYMMTNSLWEVHHSDRQPSYLYDRGEDLDDTEVTFYSDSKTDIVVYFDEVIKPRLSTPIHTGTAGETPKTVHEILGLLKSESSSDSNDQLLLLG